MNKLNSLKDIRKDRDYTQEDIASMINCNRSTYSDWENGDVMIPLNRLDELSFLYNVRLSSNKSNNSIVNNNAVYVYPINILTTISPSSISVIIL